jgi:hypothetical protein
VTPVETSMVVPVSPRKGVTGHVIGRPDVVSDAYSVVTKRLAVSTMWVNGRSVALVFGLTTPPPAMAPPAADSGA